MFSEILPGITFMEHTKTDTASIIFLWISCNVGVSMSRTSIPRLKFPVLIPSKRVDIGDIICPRIGSWSIYTQGYARTRANVASSTNPNTLETIVKLPSPNHTFHPWNLLSRSICALERCSIRTCAVRAHFACRPRYFEDTSVLEKAAMLILLQSEGCLMVL